MSPTVWINHATVDPDIGQKFSGIIELPTTNVDIVLPKQPVVFREHTRNLSDRCCVHIELLQRVRSGQATS